jgi:hypothetical protein
MSSPTSSAVITMVVKERPVFANELWLVILQYFFASLASFKSGRTVIDDKLFELNLGGGILSRFRRVSKNFAACAFEAFYQIYEFKFAEVWSRCGAYQMMRFPPFSLHKCLRSIQVVVHLHDYWMAWVPGADTSVYAANGWAQTAIVSATSLLAHCAGARALLVVSRMPFLNSLDIKIDTSFRNPQAAIAVIKSAGLAVRAREVKLTIDPGFPSKVWHTELILALTL